MKRVLGVILGGLLAALPASCTRTEIGSRMEMGAQETQDVPWPAGGEIHRHGPGGSVADMDLSQFDPVTREKIEAVR